MGAFLPSSPLYLDSDAPMKKPLQRTKPQILPVLVVFVFFFVAVPMVVWFGLILGSSLRQWRFLPWSRGFFPLEEIQVASALEPAWYGLKGGEHCLRYATREYTARLVGDPAVNGQEMMKLCKETPAEIHGRTLFTDFCQDLGFGRGVWGFWIVDFEENDCETKWGNFIDLGCVQSMLNDGQTKPTRRIESHLENLQQGSSWQIMCVTTPANVDGLHFGYPDECRYSPSAGTYGEWDLADSSCKAS